MYTGQRSQSDFSNEWMNKTDAFLKRAFGKAAKFSILVLCPCSKCNNKRMQNKDTMGKHLLKNGFTPDYTRWVHHGEAHHMREEVVRPRVEAYDADAGVADMLDDVHQAQFAEGCDKEDVTPLVLASLFALALHEHSIINSYHEHCILFVKLKLMKYSI
jgi:hypothetical protein